VVGEQRPGVRDHDRVVVHVGDADAGLSFAGDLVDRAGPGKPGPNIDELADPGLGGQVPGDPGQERPVVCRSLSDSRYGRGQAPPGRPVGGVMVLPAYQPVIDPGRIRDALINPAWTLLR
jgi:hypothetical protein